MGTDMTSHVEVLRETGVWERISWRSFDKLEDGPVEWRSYNMYGWLAGIRNYAGITPIADMRGLPEDASAEVAAGHESGCDIHGASWLTVDELLAVDYDQDVEDRRGDGHETLPPGEGETLSLREFLGEPYFRDLDVLRALNDKRPTRVVFWFD